MKQVEFTASLRLSGHMMVPENLEESELVEYIIKNLELKHLHINDIEYEDIDNVVDENGEFLYKIDRW